MIVGTATVYGLLLLSIGIVYGVSKGGVFPWLAGRFATGCLASTGGDGWCPAGNADDLLAVGELSALLPRSLSVSESKGTVVPLAMDLSDRAEGDIVALAYGLEAFPLFPD